MNWWEYIQANPAILNGKPVIKGTRLSVEFIVSLLANGWTQTEILENYPQLQDDHLRAIFLFLAESLREETLYALPQGV
jgi:uncharacterized protein (DUF433 family)